MKEKSVGVRSKEQEKFEKAYVAIPLPDSGLLSWILQMNHHKHFVHLSLYFLGDVDQNYLPEIKSVISSHLETLRGFVITPTKLDVIGNSQQAFVIKVESSPEIAEFRKSLEKDLPKHTAFNLPFTPHITIKSADFGIFPDEDVMSFLQTEDKSSDMAPVIPKIVGVYYRTDGATALLASYKI